jgi:hypothetical protein
MPEGSVAQADVPAGLTVTGVRTVADALEALL